jgi:hypothetical protein
MCGLGSKYKTYGKSFSDYLDYQCHTPAMASGLSDNLWTIKELIEKAAS